MSHDIGEVIAKITREPYETDKQVLSLTIGEATQLEILIEKKWEDIRIVMIEIMRVKIRVLLQQDNNAEGEIMCEQPFPIEEIKEGEKISLFFKNDLVGDATNYEIVTVATEQVTLLENIKCSDSFDAWEAHTSLSISIKPTS